ncbi:MAG: hypothetical protein ACTHN5_17645 [Phycisphaerae bacterium]
MADMNEHGQVKDEMGPEGKLMSHEQDVGELSAQNRGGTTRRGAEETKRLEEDDVEQAEEKRAEERAEDRALAEKLDIDDEVCEGDEESNEEVGIGNTLADEAAEEAVERPTESYVSDVGKGKKGRKRRGDEGDLSAR